MIQSDQILRKHFNLKVDPSKYLDPNRIDENLITQKKHKVTKTFITLKKNQQL